VDGDNNRIGAIAPKNNKHNTTVQGWDHLERSCPAVLDLE
jgi:hypothetical protein